MYTTHTQIFLFIYTYIYHFHSRLIFFHFFLFLWVWRNTKSSSEPIWMMRCANRLQSYALYYALKCLKSASVCVPGFYCLLLFYLIKRFNIGTLAHFILCVLVFFFSFCSCYLMIYLFFSVFIWLAKFNELTNKMRPTIWLLKMWCSFYSLIKQCNYIFILYTLGCGNHLCFVFHCRFCLSIWIEMKSSWN